MAKARGTHAAFLVAGFNGNYEQMHMLFAQSKALFEEVGDETAITDVLKDQGGMAILSFGSCSS